MVFFLKMTPSPAERWCLRTKFYPLAILDTWGDVSWKYGVRGRYHSVRGKAYKVHERGFSLYTNVISWTHFGFSSHNDPLPGREVVSKIKVLPIGYTRHMGDVS